MRHPPWLLLASVIGAVILLSAICKVLLVSELGPVDHLRSPPVRMRLLLDSELRVIKSTSPNQIFGGSNSVTHCVRLFGHLCFPGSTSIRSPDGSIDHAVASPTFDQTYANLPFGTAIFNAPDHMTMARTQVIELAIANSVPIGGLPLDPEALGIRRDTTVKLSPVMQASLSAGGAFDVSPTGSQPQAMISSEPNN